MGTEEKVKCLREQIEQLKERTVRRRCPVGAFQYIPVNDGDVLAAHHVDAVRRSNVEVRQGELWGQDAQSFVLRTEFLVPEEWSGDSVFMRIALSGCDPSVFPEALAYIDEEPVVAIDRNHQEIFLPASCCDGKKHELILHGWYPRVTLARQPAEPLHHLGVCEVLCLDADLYRFLIKATVLLDSANLIDEPQVAHQLVKSVEQALARISNGVYADALKEGAAVLEQGLEQAGSSMDVTISAIGHCHIDVAWLWTVAQSKLKAGRSFHTVLHLMDRYPDYTFTQSQPHLYASVKENYPVLFERIQKKVKSGNWEPIGGMWVEADCNISGAESLARQFLLGRRFFRDNFGENADSEVLWVPDTFGFNHALPQLMKLAGIRYFFTTKLFWNDHNRLPYESFWWQGLDGTKVLSHFSCTPGPNTILQLLGTYNGMGDAADVYNTWETFQQKDVHNDVVTCFGYGDGGGGPTAQMLEQLDVLKDMPHMPKARNRKAIEFFQGLEKQAGDRLPVWSDELYLEYHRGTYTTQSRIKRYNRKCEVLLHNAEMLASMALTRNPDFDYPQAELNRCWTQLCLNQFHDIIPGTSIQEVNEKACEEYEELQQAGQEICERIAGGLCSVAAADYVLFNLTSFERNDSVFLPDSIEEDETVVREDGTAVPHQVVEGGTLLSLGTLKPHSITAVRKQKTAAVSTPNGFVEVDGNRLENSFVKVEFNSCGEVVSLYDKELERELIAEGAVGNEFQMFADVPVRFEAWEIDNDYEDRRVELECDAEISVVERGPLRASLQVTRQIAGSRLVQFIRLSSNSKMITFDTEIDWRENQKLLKVAFPVDVDADHATYDIQWGNTERSTRRNTSWEKAKYEVPAQKWADLSQPEYGVSLLNDCKYGYDINDHVMRLTLLRSSTHPDPSADNGTQVFSYAILPHAGSWCAATERYAYTYNNPVYVYKMNPAGALTSDVELDKPLIETDRQNLIVETVKKAEDERAIIVRLYESQGKDGNVKVSTGFEFDRCLESNLLEESIRTLPSGRSSVSLEYRPYQIICLKFCL